MLLVLTDLLHIKYPLLHSEFVFKDQGFYLCTSNIPNYKYTMCYKEGGECYFHVSCGMSNWFDVFAGNC